MQGVGRVGGGVIFGECETHLLGKVSVCRGWGGGVTQMEASPLSVMVTSTVTPSIRS